MQQVLAELMRRIVLGTLPLAAAGAMAVAGCECPTSTWDGSTAQTLEGQAWADVQAAAGPGGEVSMSLCQQHCSTISPTGGSGTITGCRIQLGGAPGADASTSDAGEGDAGASSADTGTLVCEIRTVTDCGGVGRRPAGLAAWGLPATGDAVGRYYADACCFEAGAALAFRGVASELEQAGAPEPLIRRCREAATDEVRHARLVEALALRHGGSPRRPEVQLEPRALADLAIENAVEGCLEETWGALLAHWQAHTAQASDVRDVMAAIASDETRHAALSWDIQAWLLPRLTAAERAEVTASFEEGLAALRERVRIRWADPLIERAGLPTPEVATTLLEQLDPVWASATA